MEDKTTYTQTLTVESKSFSASESSDIPDDLSSDSFELIESIPEQTDHLARDIPYSIKALKLQEAQQVSPEIIINNIFALLPPSSDFHALDFSEKNLNELYKLINNLSKQLSDQTSPLAKFSQHLQYMASSINYSETTSSRSASLRKEILSLIKKINLGDLWLKQPTPEWVEAHRLPCRFKMITDALDHLARQKHMPIIASNDKEMEQISLHGLEKKEVIAQTLTEADKDMQHKVMSLSEPPSFQDIKNLVNTNAYYLRTIESSLSRADYKKAYHERATALCALMNSLKTAIAEIDQQLCSKNKTSLEKKRITYKKRQQLKLTAQFSGKTRETQKLKTLRTTYMTYMRHLMLDPTWDLAKYANNPLDGQLLFLRMQTIIQEHLADTADLRPGTIKLSLKNVYDDIEQICGLPRIKINKLMELYPTHEMFQKLIALEGRFKSAEDKTKSLTLFERKKQPQPTEAKSTANKDSRSEIDKLNIISQDRDITKSELDAVFLDVLGSSSNPRFINILLESKSSELLRKELKNIFQSVEKDPKNYQKKGKEITLTNEGMQQVVILLCKSTNVTIQQNINLLRDRLESVCLKINIPLRNSKTHQMQQSLAALKKEDELIRSATYIPSPFYLFFEQEQMKERQRNLQKTKTLSLKKKSQSFKS